MSEKFEALLKAVRSGNASKVKKLLIEDDFGLISQRGESGLGLIHEAAKLQSADIMCMLMHYPNINMALRSKKKFRKCSSLLLCVWFY